MKAFLRAGFVLALASPVLSNHDICQTEGCPVTVRFASISDTRSYGLLIAAPETGCSHVRFRVEGVAFLGQTPPLSPGELAVVRLGRGFPQGENLVTIASVGCNAHPAATRRVVLAKHAPDHGWRAASD